MAGQQICLKWNSFQTNIVTSFENLWEEEGLVDVTLASDGQCIRAHKVILSACSPFFRQVFQSNPCQHPVIILQDVHFSELESLLCFVYKGEVNIGQENLPALLKAAETLQIRGLSGASEQVKEKMAIPRKASCPEGPETPLLHPPAKRHRGCSTTPPHTTTTTTNPTPPQQQHQHPPLDETPPCPATTPPLALTAKTTTAEGVAQGEGPQTQMAPSCGELMAAQSTVEMLEEEGGLLAQDEVIGEGLLDEGAEGRGVGLGGEEDEEEEVGVEAMLGMGDEEEEDDEDRPLAHLSLKMEPPEFDYPCDSNSLPLALTLTLPNSTEEVNLPSVMSKSRRVSDCHGDTTLIKGEGGNNGLQQRRRSRSRGASVGGARRKRRHCNNFIWRAPACVPGAEGGEEAAGCREGDEALLLPPPPASLEGEEVGAAGGGDLRKKPIKKQGSGRASSDEEADAMAAAEAAAAEGPSGSLPPYSLLPHACLLPSPGILSAWAKARTPEQLSCDLMRLLFSTEERLVCNVNGKMGKRRFDAHKVLLIREVVRHHYNECSGGRHGGSGGEEGGDESGERTVADFEERWKGCVTRIDTANRGLKRNLVLRGRKASFLV